MALCFMHDKVYKCVTVHSKLPHIELQLVDSISGEKVLVCFVVNPVLSTEILLDTNSILMA